MSTTTPCFMRSGTTPLNVRIHYCSLTMMSFFQRTKEWLFQVPCLPSLKLLDRWTSMLMALTIWQEFPLLQELSLIKCLEHFICSVRYESYFPDSELTNLSFAGWIYTRPEALYFWFYFEVVNLIWINIPSFCAMRASKAVMSSVSAADRYSPQLMEIVDALTTHEVIFLGANLPPVGVLSTVSHEGWWCSSLNRG